MKSHTVLVSIAILSTLALTIFSYSLLPEADAVVTRKVTIPVKVVFVGIDPTLVDTGYIKWGGNVPAQSYGEVYYPQPNITGIEYNVDYNFTFAGEEYRSRLVSYLQSVQQIKTDLNPWFSTYTVDRSGYVYQRFYPLTYAVYDANMVEDWMFTNQQELGGFPEDGWTLMFLNLTDALPSYDWASYKSFIGDYRQSPPNGTAHYYGIKPKDLDLGYRYRYRDYMTGWGSVHRFWFNDLSAGPSFQAYPEDLPLQIAVKDNRFDLHSTFGRQWLTEYLADYVSQATVNIVTPYYLYPTMYSQKYSFHVHIFDNRTSAERALVDIKSTFNPNAVKESFQDLIPYAQIEVSTTFDDLSKFPELQKIINSNYKYSDSFTAGFDFGSPQQYGIVDARAVYKYLIENMQKFEPEYHRDRSEFTDPVFAFAFSNDTVFAWNYKWLIEPFGGVALGDLALIGSSQSEFLRGNAVYPPQRDAGIGFTYDVIHEAGHNLGLTHPHDPAGPTGDFTLSPLSYFSFSYTWGQREKDALRRAHVDEIYQEINSFLNGLPSSSSTANTLRSELRSVDSKYVEMDYEGALTLALDAESAIKSQGQSEWSVPLQPPIYAVLGLIVGIAITWIFATPGGKATLRSLSRRNANGYQKPESARVPRSSAC